jgi:glucose/arabinose dehydrogenase/PKD repeat protein
MMNHFHSILAMIAVVLNVSVSNASVLPPGFSEIPVGSGWDEVVGITFAEDGRMIVWERAGRIYLFHNQQWKEVINISEEVGAWRDHGLLSITLHPNFLSNGQIFLMYVVDRHHLLHFGTPQYNPNSNEYLNATIVRITRYTLDPANEFLSIVPNSRFILVGESKTTGIPIMFESHGVGTLLFGTDGTLLASCGDGASFVGGDTGGDEAWSYATQGLADGILKPKEDVGAFRAQLLDCHNGKILRIDPNTGDGLPSNPFFNAAAPRSPQSRVWALGLRNPYRMTLRPGSGSHIPADANPGTLYIGDVGWGLWEELNICDASGLNFGWPLFEGMEGNGGYYNATVYNKDAPNPLHGQSGCNRPFFLFRELLHHDTLNPNPSFPNPCNPNVQIPETVHKFVHRRPEIDWGNPDGPARTGIYNGWEPAVVNIGAPGSPISGQQFPGNCSIGGVWYTGQQYPAQYQNTYFHADYGAGWIRYLIFNTENQASFIGSFMTGGENLIGLATHPVTGDIYYVNWYGIYRIAYSSNQNQPPTVIATFDVQYGPSPLTVQFTAEESSDPEGSEIQFHWDFGDGEVSTEANPVHTFSTPGQSPIAFNVTLSVTDNQNLSSHKTFVISVNNSPPQVQIVSPVTGSTIAVPGPNQSYQLIAEIADAEHAASELSCVWQVVLHHNNHTHPEPIDENCITSATLSPVGCDGNTYFYRIRLAVTDTAGLTEFDEVDIHPYCGGNAAPVANADFAEVDQGESLQIAVLANDSDADGTLNPATIAIVQPSAHGQTQIDATAGTILYVHNGNSSATDTFAYTVNDNLGGTSNIAQVEITIQPRIPGDINGDDVVNISDLLAVIGAWGPCPSTGNCDADVYPHPQGDGVVNVGDLLFIISNWG